MGNGRLSLPRDRAIGSRLGEEAWVWGLVAGLAVICGFLPFVGSVHLAIVVIALCLMGIVSYTRVISFDALSLIVVVVISLFLLSRYGLQYQIQAGDIFFKTTFFMMAFFLILLALKAFFLRVVNNEAHNNVKVASFKVLLLFILTGIASTLINAKSAQGISYSLLAMLKFLTPLCYVYLVPRLQLKPSDIRIMLKTFLFIGLVIASLVITGSFFPRFYESIFGLERIGSEFESESFARIALPFGGPNGIGAVLIMILPLCYFTYLYEKKKLYMCFLGVTSFLLIAAILVTLNRSNFGLLFCLLVGFLFHRGNYSKIKKYILLFLLMVMAVVLFMKFDFSRLYKGVESQGRFDSWKTGMIIFKDHPIFGVAPNTIYRRTDTMHVALADYSKLVKSDRLARFYIKSEYLRTSYKGHTTLYNPHNVYVMVLVEYGLIGFTLFLWIIVNVVRALRRGLRKSTLAIKESYALKGMMWGFVAFILLQIQGDYITLSHEIATFLWIYAGVGIKLSSFLQQGVMDDYYLAKQSRLGLYKAM